MDLNDMLKQALMAGCKVELEISMEPTTAGNGMDLRDMFNEADELQEQVPVERVKDVPGKELDGPAIEKGMSQDDNLGTKESAKEQPAVGAKQPEGVEGGLAVTNATKEEIAQVSSQLAEVLKAVRQIAPMGSVRSISQKMRQLRGRANTRTDGTGGHFQHVAGGTTAGTSVTSGTSTAA